MTGGFRANGEESHKSRLGVADLPHVMRFQFNRLAIGRGSYPDAKRIGAAFWIRGDESNQQEKIGH
jgi:hypothetical protein